MRLKHPRLSKPLKTAIPHIPAHGSVRNIVPVAEMKTTKTVLAGPIPRLNAEVSPSISN
jgi:hypothetical protein